MKDVYIHDWNKHQSYRGDRGQPPWIKIHRSVVRHPKWVQLTDAERGQLVSIWILAADRDGAIQGCPKTIRKLAMIDDEPDLERFISLGFIDREKPDATVTSTWRQADATPDVNVTPSPPHDDNRYDAQSRAEQSKGEQKREEQKRAHTTARVREAVSELRQIHGRGSKAAQEAAYAEIEGDVEHAVIVRALKSYAETLTPEFRGLNLERWLTERRWVTDAPKKKRASGMLRPWEMNL
jgi:hypothetical protein